MNYIGVDPSWTCTGIVAIDNDGNTATATLSFKRDKKSGLWVLNIKSSIRNSSSSINITGIPHNTGNTNRIVAAHREMGGLLSHLTILPKGKTVVGIEVPMGRHQGAGATTDQVYAAYVMAICGDRYDLTTYTPGQIKKFTTGKGNAKKELMMKEVYKRWGFETDSHDVADAYAIARLVEHDYAKESRDEDEV